MFTSVQQEMKQQIKACFDASGKTLKQTAKEMGCHTTHLRRVLDANTSNTFESLETALQHFGKTVEITVKDK